MKFNEQMSQKKEDEFDVILRNFNSQDGSLQEYLEKLKEEDISKYYKILEKLAEKKSNDQMKESIIPKPQKETKKSKEPEKTEGPGYDLYGRFNKFKK